MSNQTQTTTVQTEIETLKQALTKMNPATANRTSQLIVQKQGVLSLTSLYLTAEILHERRAELTATQRANLRYLRQEIRQEAVNRVLATMQQW